MTPSTTAKRRNRGVDVVITPKPPFTHTTTSILPRAQQSMSNNIRLALKPMLYHASQHGYDRAMSSGVVARIVELGIRAVSQHGL
jgi:hypothetical protein